jgi:hypothetical protein
MINEYAEFRGYRARVLGCRLERPFKTWIADFLAKLTDLHLDVVESFQNADGSRVTSRWILTGKNNGLFGTEPDQQDVAMTGTAVWAVREDGKLLTNWVERASWELSQRLRL